MLQYKDCKLILPERGIEVPIHPLKYNAITPEAIPPPGLDGPLVYAGHGRSTDLNGKDITGAVILMELTSGKSWQKIAGLGAKALIFVDRGPMSKSFFLEKTELSPVEFPIFWMPRSKVRELFGDYLSAPDGIVASKIRLTAGAYWEEASAENVYCLIPGRDEELKEELLLIEAFYDSTDLVPGRSPGADEACGLATLLELAKALKEDPPARSVLLVATSGHAQTLYGMREMIWGMRIRSRELKKMRRKIKEVADRADKVLDIFELFSEKKPIAPESFKLLKEAVADRIKTEVDTTSRRLMRMRLEQKNDADRKMIDDLAARRLLLSRLNWRPELTGLPSEEEQLLQEIIPLARQDFEVVRQAAGKQQKALKGALDLRRRIGGRDVAAVVSLHLSSHGDGVGAFNRGWLYSLRSTINRVEPYSRLVEVLNAAAAEAEKILGFPSLYKDTLRPSRLRSWQSYFIDRPPLSGEVSALAGYLGISLVTLHDSRPSWGTPYDLPKNVDFEFAAKQESMVRELVKALAQAPSLDTGKDPHNGFSTVTGRANFIRHGELFADQPAPGTVILAYQGPGRYYTMVDALGVFRLKGVANKKHAMDKVIIEGYKFNPETGAVTWAIDKKQTGIAAYRVKMQRTAMETDLVMFACKQSTLFDLLEPRSFRYMTKVQLLDGRLEAPPLRYWYSRIDTRSSIITSLFLEPGVRFKMTLSDTVLRKKMILLNASPEHPEGLGYLIDNWPSIPRTQYMVARDMWALLSPRIAGLEKHGIYNEKIRTLQTEGVAALKKAEADYAAKMYDSSIEAASRSWALASRVYDTVEKTQKDVLFGVLFYIALFVPFAFCLERLLFSYTDIHRRIIAFGVLLLLLIAVIYHVHPAFKLAYSPTVVILAFFIMGLSLIVTLIIFFRFEEEMVRMQKRASQVSATELSRWQAFVSAFFLGVSNLRRRRLRTALTCATLIILTFTIMSFTSVQSLRHRTRIEYQNFAPYVGFMLKKANWMSLPTEALGSLVGAFEDKGTVVPRIWLEGRDRSQAEVVTVNRNGRVYQGRGLVGLSHAEPEVTGIDRTLVGGRWLNEGENNAVLLPERMAEDMGIDPRSPQGSVLLWGAPFEVVGVFSGKKFQEHLDLDGEPLTPVTFPGDVNLAMTEIEMEAIESGDDVQAFQSRYQHVDGDLTVVIPYSTLLAAGGKLKGVAVRPVPDTPVRAMAEELVDRFKLTLFLGEKDGTFLYQASDTLSYSGVPNIVIPLVISIFIVLNTMIGSVYERKREIGIYTSVGLAPSHVSFLFIAESMAFAVLSVVLGYLLAQGASSVFAGTSLWAGITVNYSSLAGVAAMLLLFLVVLISVIYPSRVAAKIAIPDVSRSWSLPEAVDNVLEVTLPVLFKFDEIQGVGGYIYHYFIGHQDVTHGLFSTGKIDLVFECLHAPHSKSPEEENNDACPQAVCEYDNCLHMRTKVWLAPFDFGIMQKVDIRFCPAEDDPGFLEIRISLARQAGEANAWKRINKAFLNQFRKQLLVWRSLNIEAQMHYKQVFESWRDETKE